METREWRNTDKSNWPQGEWTDEPDKMQWQDAETKLPCLIVRNNGGALCGYVGVTEGHPAFDASYESLDVDVHGGLTFADFCQPHADEGRGICHTPDKGEPDRVYWLGFDCAHLGDISPAYDLDRHVAGFGESYKDVRYVQSECRSLARQLAAMS